LIDAADLMNVTCRSRNSRLTVTRLRKVSGIQFDSATNPKGILVLTPKRVFILCKS